MSSNSLHTVAHGARASVPVVLAYLGIGFAAGALGQRAGLSPAEVALLSLLVFAGSAQFIFAELLAGNPITLVATVFLVNLRHFLYASAFSVKVKGLSMGRRFLIGAQMTDETFAVASSLTHRPLTSARGMVTMNVLSYSSWAAGNIMGAIVGEAGSEVFNLLGIEFALAAMFAALLMLQVVAVVRKFQMLCVAAAGTVGIVVLELWHPHPLNLLVAASGAAAMGAWLFGMPKSVAQEREEGDGA